MTIDRRGFLAATAAGAASLNLPAADKAAGLTVVVTDPLAAPLSCPCVKGYAQRDYEKLGKYLEGRLGRPVQVFFHETLNGALAKKTDGRADLVIGKDSVIRAESKAAGVGLSHMLALTGKEGTTTQTGLVVVAASDKALSADQLKGYTIYFGPAEADEKHAAAAALFRDLNIPVPAKPEICTACTDGAQKVIEEAKSGRKVATVISSYAKPLLEGCGTIKKGDLKVVGETDPVPFVAAFVNDKLTAADRDAVKAALLDVAKDAALCAALETKGGFVMPPSVKKK